MSILPYVQQFVGTAGVVKVSWLALKNGDTGAPFTGVAGSRVTVQVTGTYGAGGTALIEGSNNGLADVSPTWFTLSAEPTGVPINTGGDIFAKILENPHMVRPNITAGDAATTIDVRMTIAALM